MLFQPWRQEVEIIGNHKTYLDAFISCRDKIESALHYHERLEYLRKSKDDLDTIIEDLLEKNKKTQINDDRDDWFQISEVQEVMEELRNKSANQDLEKLISNMNSDQQSVFNFVKSNLYSHDTPPMRHFVSGVGGVGKSYLIIKKLRN